MISFDCPHCGKNLKTKDDKAGMKSKCPGCGEIVKIPSSTSSESGDNPYSYNDGGDGLTKPCPACGEEVDSDASKCSFCGENLRAGAGRGGKKKRGQVMAGFWLRFVAAFVDGILVGIVNYGIQIMVYLVVGIPLAMIFQQQQAQQFGQPIDPKIAIINAGLGLLQIIIYWLYGAFMESSDRQATLGKMAVGIIVTDLNGDRLSFGRATGRHFAKIISGCTCLIGHIMAAFTEQKQALHDIIAGCLVVRK